MHIYSTGYNDMFASFLLAIAYSWIIGRAADVGSYVKVRLGLMRTPNNMDFVPEDTLKMFATRIGELPDQAMNRSLNCTGSYSKAEQCLANSNDRTFESINSTANMTISVQPWTENDSDLKNKSSVNIQRDKMAESLEGLYKRLQEMDENNAIRFRNIVESNKETAKLLKEEEAKRIKQENETKIEFQGMRRRIESSEKRSH